MKKIIHSLIKNLEKPEKPHKIDLIIDGGGFKAAYIVGNLMYLKEMEKLGFIEISRISGTSVGSLLGLLYFLDELKIVYKLLPVLSSKYRENYDFSKTFNIIKDKMYTIIGEKGLDSFNNRLYINYFDTKENKTVLTNTYENVDSIYNNIHYSCFIPFIFNGKPTISNKIDGILPFIFPKRENTKILFLSTITVGNIHSLHEILIFNDKNITYKMIQGILDMHSFYSNKTASMSYYIDNNSFVTFFYFLFRKIVLYCIIIFIHIFNFLQDRTHLNTYILFFKKIIITLNNYY
jgi:hypothetical protein